MASARGKATDTLEGDSSLHARSYVDVLIVSLTFNAYMATMFYCKIRPKMHISCLFAGYRPPLQTASPRKEVRRRQLRELDKAKKEAKRQKTNERRMDRKKNKNKKKPEMSKDAAPPHFEGLVARGNVGTLHYEIEQTRDRRFKQLRVDQHNFEIRFEDRGKEDDNSVTRMIDAFDGIYRALERVQQFLLERYPDHEDMDLQLTLMANKIDPSLNMSPVPIDDPDAITDLMRGLEAILNSDEDIPLDESFRVSAVVTNIPPLRVGASLEKLGAKFKDPEECNGKYHQFMPELEGYEDCCLLLALVVALAWNKELHANKDRATLNQDKTITEDWRRLKYLTREQRGGQRKASARKHLLAMVKAFCQEHDVDPKQFKMTKIEKLRPFFDRLNINLRIFVQSQRYEMRFRHPKIYDSAKQTVNLLLLRNEVRDAYHCGVIRLYDAFFHGKGRDSCDFCYQPYTTQYIKQHNCQKRERCMTCKRSKAYTDDYADYEVKKRLCWAHLEREGSFPCKKCGKVCLTKSCYRYHLTECKKRVKCKKCGRVYKDAKKKGTHKHKCTDTICPFCKVIYGWTSGCGRDLSTHPTRCSCAISSATPWRMIWSTSRRSWDPAAMEPACTSAC